ncbi:hypothetical protein C7S16_3763 [Burkholderia thailandensis]|uniref:Uncharacterized protein n=1 Tax=Burkholderia thailandensis TaxID=57975 RepID=A0AAW9D1G0_BURTH|nr:hypothetical protein [Burkholderia thailandensis]
MRIFIHHSSLLHLSGDSCCDSPSFYRAIGMALICRTRLRRRGPLAVTHRILSRLGG